MQKREGCSQFPAIIMLFSVESTNNYALHLIREDLAQHGTTVFADEQTAGKGQRGKKWVAERGQNLQMSVVINPDSLNLHNQFSLSAIAALATREFLSEISGKEFLIKWPNDIYFQDRKAGGILIENAINGQIWRWAVVGAGLNINQTVFGPDLPNPVSVKQLTGNTYDCHELAEILQKKMLTAYNDLKSQPLESIMQRYNQQLYKKGKNVKLKKDNRVFEATIKTVNSRGQLVVEHSFEECFDFGDVVWVIHPEPSIEKPHI